MITVEHLNKRFKSGDSTVVATNDVSFSLPESCLVSIVGKSGSGKSTLLSLLGALDKPSDGVIKVGDRNIAAMRDHELITYRCQSIGFVFQSYNLIPNLTAVENVMLPMEFAGIPRGTRVARAQKLLEQVGLTADKQRRKPGKLSGGEQQRVAIARALANRPKLILADEPTGNLDTETGKLIFELLQNLAHSENTTIIVVTHDDAIASKTDIRFRLQDGTLTKLK